MYATHLLQLVVIDDVLVGRARLCEGVQLVHVVHVAPQRRQVRLEAEGSECESLLASRQHYRPIIIIDLVGSVHNH